VCHRLYSSQMNWRCKSTYILISFYDFLKFNLSDTIFNFYVRISCHLQYLQTFLYNLAVKCRLLIRNTASTDSQVQKEITYFSGMIMSVYIIFCYGSFHDKLYTRIHMAWCNIMPEKYVISFWTWESVEAVFLIRSQHFTE
jgi:hypothetical protein